MRNPISRFSFMIPLALVRALRGFFKTTSKLWDMNWPALAAYSNFTSLLVSESLPVRLYIAYPTQINILLPIIKCVNSSYINHTIRRTAATLAA